MLFTDDDIRGFAVWSGDHNPIHVDADHARETHFGQPVVHGMLTAIRALESAAPSLRESDWRSLDVEFRRAVFTGSDYSATVTRSDGETVVSLQDDSDVVLTIRSGPGVTVESEFDAPRRSSSRESATFQDETATATPLRHAPARPSEDLLKSGLACRGIYPAPQDPGPGAPAVPDLVARVLALCSYIVGMELPGQQSLFTHLTVVFDPGVELDGAHSQPLRYQAQSVRFDDAFRLLDVLLTVTTLAGAPVATAQIRSYVPFSPLSTDIDVLQGRLGSENETLAGQVALVVGGSRGVGADLAAALALAGCHVYASARHPSETAVALRDNLRVRGASLELLQGDAGDRDWCTSAVSRIVSQHGHLDLLVLCACAPPRTGRLEDEPATQARYIADNLQLIEAPLAAGLPALAERRGGIVFLSSSFVDTVPPGFGAYVAVKHAGESLVRAAVNDHLGLSALIARAPVLRTRWNDTPAGVAGAIPADHVASRIVEHLTETAEASGTESLDTFPPYAETDVATAAHAPDRPDFSIRIAATFTTDAMAAGLTFWTGELGIDPEVRFAPYNQVLQTLVDPASALNSNRPGLNVVLLRVRDWMRELTEEQAGSKEFLESYLVRMSEDLVRAVKAHRGQAAPELLLLLCPSDTGAPDAIDDLLSRQAAVLATDLAGVPGVDVVDASDYHERYGVASGDVYDVLRDEVAHIPYRDPYLLVLTAIIARQASRRLRPQPKAVVVDCDNTLWRGIVGEVGAGGVAIEAHHRALHTELTRLAKSGVLVCLCSKNEEADVWSVFDTRNDFLISRDAVVAAAINWLPKSENLRTLAERLNLGLDSFLFLDDNPIECAEVRAACPEVLTLEWPNDPDGAQRLLSHTWEFDTARGTEEDRRRTEMYREEFQRQAARADTLSFGDFIASLQLEVDVSPLVPADIRRASQLTLRTNQFNFTTIRRDEADIKELTTDGRHELRTIRVRDRFGDYGLVGLLVLKTHPTQWQVDTLLLSCRVLGRGVEHRIAAEAGRLATAAGAGSVRFRVDTTPRNTLARAFLEVLATDSTLDVDATGVAVTLPAKALASMVFEPVDGAAHDAVEAAPDVTDQPPTERPSGNLRDRERQIARTAFELGSIDELSATIEDVVEPGPSGAPRQRIRHGAVARDGAGNEEIAPVVHAAFARALRKRPEEVAATDNLEALGCSSLKIVEITVALHEQYPWLPGTLLFEHRTVSAIVSEIDSLMTHDESVSDEPVTRGQHLNTRSRKPEAATDIAVVGLHLRVAGADSADALWDLLSTGRSSVRAVPASRRHFLKPFTEPGRHWAGLLEDPGHFDPEFFGVSPREAAFMDPQLRLFLEVAWGALEDAGLAGDRRDRQTGVFVGVMYGDYRAPANDAARESGTPYRSWEGFSLANRLSHVLGFSGPSLAIDTACSSSGTATHLACRALRAGECGTALVGGVNLILDPDRFGSLERLGILTSRGQCEPFGADADGTVLGEGAGVVVLRPLADAVARGDRIYGVIKGTGLSTGSGTVGFTAPNPQAQAEAITQALRSASVDPRTISYVETHGTGTKLGDPIEVRGLTLAYGNKDLYDASLPIDQQCGIGSIKPNIGHLEAGAGVLGLIKVLLQLHRRQLLPSITSPEPNPQILFEDLPFHVQRTLGAWKQPVARIGGAEVAVPRRAGLSSFGVGGANAHIIVEEAPGTRVEPSRTPERTSHLILLSAHTDHALDAQAASLENWLADHDGVPMGDVAFSLATGRRHHPHRLALVASEGQTVRSALGEAAAGRLPTGAIRGVVDPGVPPRTAFLFTGQGAQYAEMGRDLYESQPAFRGALDECVGHLEGELDRPLLDVLFAPSGSEAAALLDQTGYTQPALFAIEYALAQLWQSWGVVPDFVMGHSVGEIAALCVAGGISLEDGARLIATRGRLMQALPAGGQMTSVMADEARVLEALRGFEDGVTIAAVNAPGQVVISGGSTAVAQVAARLTSEGVRVKPLTVSHAFHSPLMKPMLREYDAVVRATKFSDPRIPFVSGVTGALVGSEITEPEYWQRQVMDSVRFMHGMTALDQLGADTFLEVGPQPVLLGLGRQCLSEQEAERVWVPSLRKGKDSWHTLLGSLGQMWVRGAQIDWSGFDAPYTRGQVSLPTFSFDHAEYWIEPPVAPNPLARTPACYEVAWMPKAFPVPERPGKDAANSCWLIFADEAGLGRALADELRDRRISVQTVSRGTGFARISDDQHEIDPANAEDYVRVLDSARAADTPLEVLYLWGLDAPTPGHDLAGLQSAEAHTIEYQLHLVRALTQEDASPARFWGITNNATVAGAEPSAPLSVAQAPLWGFGRTVALEHPDAWGGLIDLLPDVSSDRHGLQSTVRMLADELLAPDGEDQVALRPDARYVARLRAVTPTGVSPLQIRPNATYLITGGLGAIGLHLAAWLVDQGARHLVLTTRRTEEQGRRAPADALSTLEDCGAAVVVASCDVSREADVDRLLARIADGQAPLGGVIHAAGVESVIPLQMLTATEAKAVLAPKVSGAWLLHERTRHLGLDLFLCMSSMASVMGSQGRAHYAAGNAFLDLLVAERQRTGLSGTAINWGPWRGGGMASDVSLERFERIGNHGLEPEAALRVLDDVLAAGRAQTLVADVSWPSFKPAYEARRSRPLIAEIDGGGAAPPQGPTRESGPETPLGTGYAAVPLDPDAVAAAVRAELNATLGFPLAREVPDNQRFTDLGMDSLLAVEFGSRLKTRFGVEGAGLVFTYPTCGALTAHLVEATQPVRPAVADEDGRQNGIDEAGLVDFHTIAFPDRSQDQILPRWRWMFERSA